MKLTEEQIRIKVAELLKWTKIESSALIFGILPGTQCEYRELPNYPRDLNACAEIRATLKPHQIEAFTRYLIRNFKADCERHELLWYILSLPAIDQCLAFLYVHGINAELVVR